MYSLAQRRVHFSESDSRIKLFTDHLCSTSTLETRNRQGSNKGFIPLRRAPLNRGLTEYFTCNSSTKPQKVAPTNKNLFKTDVLGLKGTPQTLKQDSKQPASFLADESKANNTILFSPQEVADQFIQQPRPLKEQHHNNKQLFRTLTDTNTLSPRALHKYKINISFINNGRSLD